MADTNRPYKALQEAFDIDNFIIDTSGNLVSVNGGHIQLIKTDQTTFSRLCLPILNTAPSSAGLTKGDIWLAKATTDVYRLAMCISTAGGTVKYGSRIIRSTIGTASH